LPGFEQEGPVSVYNRDSVFDYINGEAEMYLPHGFRLLYALNFRAGRRGPLMTVDVYDMGAPRGARTVLRDLADEDGSKVEGIGDSAFTDGITVTFQRSRYFVRLLPSQRAEEHTEAVLTDLLALGRSLDAALR